MINHPIRIAGSGRTSVHSAKLNPWPSEREREERRSIKRTEKKVYEGLTGGSGPRSAPQYLELTNLREDFKFQYQQF